MRNILDRYPFLPLYLAFRLAKANCARANRLDLTRHSRGDQLTLKPIQVTGHNRPPSSKRPSSTDDVAQSPKPLSRTQDGMNPPPKTDKPKPHMKREFSSSRAESGFWTVGGSRSRAASVHSQSSGRNTSLHGSGRLDLGDQNLSFPDDRSRRSSASFSESSATFSPPPVYIERGRYRPAGGLKEIMDQAPKPLRFFCDICEQDIEVLRRRDWQ